MNTNDNSEEQYLKWVSTISSEEEFKSEIEAIADRENSENTINRIINSLIEE